MHNKHNTNIEGLDNSGINIENIGRESHTYLYHIISNYENLSKKTIFIKAQHQNKYLNIQWLKFSHSLKNINQFINFSLNISLVTIKSAVL